MQEYGIMMAEEKYLASSQSKGKESMAKVSKVLIDGKGKRFSKYTVTADKQS